jgi:hypothetical protein
VADVASADAQNAQRRAQDPELDRAERAAGAVEAVAGDRPRIATGRQRPGRRDAGGGGPRRGVGALALGLAGVDLMGVGVQPQARAGVEGVRVVGVGGQVAALGVGVQQRLGVAV